jgi:hypothetical protein
MVTRRALRGKAFGVTFRASAKSPFQVQETKVHTGIESTSNMDFFCEGIGHGRSDHRSSRCPCSLKLMFEAELEAKLARVDLGRCS